MVQWLRLCTSTAGGMHWIPGQETNILHTTWCGQKKKKDRVMKLYLHLISTVKQSGALRKPGEELSTLGSQIPPLTWGEGES